MGRFPNKAFTILFGLILSVCLFIGFYSGFLYGQSVREKELRICSFYEKANNLRSFYEYWFQSKYGHPPMTNSSFSFTYRHSFFIGSMTKLVLEYDQFKESIGEFVSKRGIENEIDLKNKVEELRNLISTAETRSATIEPNTPSEHFFRNKFYSLHGMLSGEDDIYDSTNDIDLERSEFASRILSLPSIPTGFIPELVAMWDIPLETTIWRDCCLQFLGSALERKDGVTDDDRALACETLISALSSTNATFAATALRALRRALPSDPLVASNVAWRGFSSADLMTDTHHVFGNHHETEKKEMGYSGTESLATTGNEQ